MIPENGIEHLINAQTRDLTALDAKIKELEESIYAYDSLVDTLSTVDSKVKHDIMVPLGKNAFIPGQLIHTNEVWVHLGADLLSLRSAKQAVTMAESRRENIKKTLSMLQEGRKITQDWKSTAEQMGIEFSPKGGGITEEVSEEEHNQWREAHKARAREARKKQAEARSQNPSLGIDDDAEKKLWAKLDELELLEELEDEELLNEDRDEPVKPEAPKDTAKRDEAASNYKPPVRNRVELHFKHSPTAAIRVPPSSSGVIGCPADIGRTGLGTRRKSSLKTPSGASGEKPERSRVMFGDSVSVKTIDNLATPTPWSQSSLRATSILLPPSAPTFPGVRAAHVPQRPVAVAQSVAESTPSMLPARRSSADGEQSQEAEPPKRVSRFRAARVMEKTS